MILRNQPEYDHQQSVGQDYRNYDRYYSHRSRVLGLQNGIGTPVYGVILRAVSSARRIIDVGCGRGMYLVPLENSGKDVTGYDFNGENVELLSSHGHKARQADCVAGLPEEASGADASICAEVLEHLNDEQAQSLLKNIRDALADRGVLVVTVPYREDLEKNICVCPGCDLHFHRDGHARAYEQAGDLVTQVTRAGFIHLRDYVIYPQLATFRITPFWVYLLFSRFRPEKLGTLIGIFRKQ